MDASVIYIRIMRSHIAQWHSGMKSHPPFSLLWTLVEQRGLLSAHALVGISV